MRNDPRSHGLWEASAPAAPATTALAGTVRADVAIIGAGYTGLSAALHLAEGGARVVVLEAEEIGFGGSGRNVGLVNAGMWVMPDDLVSVLGPLHGDRLLESLGDGPSLVFDIIARHAIACEAERHGTLHCAVGHQGLAEITARAQQWQARGAPVSLLDAAETAAAVGTSAYTGALLDRRAGTVQPLAYARGLADAAIRASAIIHTKSPVVAAEDDGHIWRLRTPGGIAEADAVLLATNAYTQGVWPAVGAELVRLPYFNLATRPLSDNLRRSILPGRHGAWDSAKILSSFRLDHAGRLVFGSVGALRGTGHAIHRAWGERAMARLFPQLAGIGFDYAWYGLLGMTANSLPRFHRLGRSLISFSGYNGRGIAPGTVFGSLAAGLLLGHLREEDLPLPVTPPAPVSFRGLRETYFATGAQLAHLTGERRAERHATSHDERPSRHV